jgi:translation initiation factor IF-3
LLKAESAGLDLVEISPNVSPPVCKILDFGKYKYEAQKKASVAKKKQKETILKEIKMRPGTDVHDYNFKVKLLKSLLSWEIRLNSQLDLKDENFKTMIKLRN